MTAIAVPSTVPTETAPASTYRGSWPTAYLSSAPQGTAGSRVGVAFLLGVAALIALIVFGLVA